MRAGVGSLPMQPCWMDGVSVGRLRVNWQASAVLRSHSIGVSDNMVGWVMTGMPERWAFKAASSSSILNTGRKLQWRPRLCRTDLSVSSV